MPPASQRTLPFGSIAKVTLVPRLMEREQQQQKAKLVPPACMAIAKKMFPSIHSVPANMLSTAMLARVSAKTLSGPPPRLKEQAAVQTMIVAVYT